MRAIQQTVECRVETILLVAALVVQHTGLQSGHRIQQGHRGNLAARQHKVTQADLHIHVRINEALVNALVAATYQHSPRAVRPGLHRSMVKPLTQRRKQHHRRRRRFGQSGPGLAHGGQTTGQRLGHHHHAGATTERPVIHAAVIALGKIPQIPQHHLHLPRLERPPVDAQ